MSDPASIRLVSSSRGIGSLESGRRRCHPTDAEFDRVRAAAAATAAAQPPEYAARSIKAYFGLSRPNACSLWQKIRLSTAFDSAQAAAPCGVRGHAEAVRHISYESGQYLVDVVIEKPEDAPEGVVAGQILRQLDGPIVPLAEIPALLLSSGELLATALTSDQGGFWLAGGLTGECELWFFLEDERVIGVTWDQEIEPLTEH